MRLVPIEHPKGRSIRLAYFMCKRYFGKVITPMKVVYARVPSAMKISMAINKLTQKGTSLDKELIFLLTTHTAQLNNCSFCVDIARAMALQGQISLDKVNTLHEYADSPLFSQAEKTALSYVEETTVQKKVSSDTFAKMKEHYSDQQIAEITVVNAAENFYNIVNIPLEIETDGLCALVPGQRTKETASITS